MMYAGAVLLILAAVFGGRKMRCAFFWPFILLALTVFNPYVFPILFIEQQGLVAQYYSFLWAVPVLLAASAGVLAVAFRFKKRWISAAIIIASAAAAIFFGTPEVSSYVDIMLPVNAMKADAELVTLCGYIMDHSLSESPLVAFERADFAEEAMAYDAAIRISGLLTEEGGEGDGGLHFQGEDYVVIGMGSKETEELLKEAGYHSIAHTPDSRIFVPEN